MDFLFVLFYLVWTLQRRLEVFRSNLYSAPNMSQEVVWPRQECRWREILL